MKTEYEMRKLDISFNEIIQKLERIGAEKVGIYHQKRYVYDFTPVQKGRWIRLRSNGKNSTLAIKEVKSLSVNGTKELEIVVSNFDDTNEILMKLGYIPRSFQENFRIEYTLDKVSFDLDKWPMIPPHLEIEGESKDDVLKAIKLMGWSMDDMTAKDIDTIYSKIYGIDLDSIKELKFNERESKFINNYECIKEV